jgi:hypothetical protein
MDYHLKSGIAMWILNLLTSGVRFDRRLLQVSKRSAGGGGGPVSVICRRTVYSI